MAIVIGNIGTRRINKDGSIDYLDGGFTKELNAKRSIPKFNTYYNEDSLPVTFQVVSNNDTYSDEKVLFSSVRDKNNNRKRFKWVEGETSHLDSGE